MVLKFGTTLTSSREAQSNYIDRTTKDSKVKTQWNLNPEHNDGLNIVQHFVHYANNSISMLPSLWTYILPFCINRFHWATICLLQRNCRTIWLFPLFSAANQAYLLPTFCRETKALQLLMKTVIRSRPQFRSFAYLCFVGDAY